MAHIHTEIENLRFCSIAPESEILIKSGDGDSYPGYFFENKLYSTDFFEILFFSEGAGQIWINDKEVVVSDNSVVFISPSQRHCYHLDMSRSKFHYLVFKEDVLLNFLEDKYFTYRLHYYYQTSLTPVMEVDAATMQDFDFVLKMIENESAFRHSDAEPVLGSLLCYLLSSLNRSYVDFYKITATSTDNNIAFRFKGMLEKGMKGKQTVDLYAKKLGVSRVTLNSAVKAQFGMTASQMIKNRLIVRIKNELVETNYSVAYISDKYGFSESNHLMRFFKAQTGRTIGQYLEDFARKLPPFHAD